MWGRKPGWSAAEPCHPPVQPSKNRWPLEMRRQLREEAGRRGHRVVTFPLHPQQAEREGTANEVQQS